MFRVSVLPLRSLWLFSASSVLNSEKRNIEYTKNHREIRTSRLLRRTHQHLANKTSRRLRHERRHRMRHVFRLQHSGWVFARVRGELGGHRTGTNRAHAN